MKTIDSTPKKDGFRMPGEFEKHLGTYIIWPERPDNWRLGGKPAQKVFAEVAREIARFEPVTVCVSNCQFANARHMLPDEVRVVEMSNDDAWIRDCGPTFVSNGKEIRGVDWRFNAWGGLHDGLYFPWDKDDSVAQKVCELERRDRYRLERFVLEGGSIHVDGEGTLVTTEECLLSEGRNPGMTKEDIEETLKEYLGIEKSSGCQRAYTSMKPTDTLTTFSALCARVRLCLHGLMIKMTRNMKYQRLRLMSLNVNATQRGER